MSTKSLSSLSKKILSLRKKNAAKKIQRGFRTQKKKNLKLFMQNGRNPLLNFSSASRKARRINPMPPKAISVFAANLLNEYNPWGRHISSFLYAYPPLLQAQIDLLDIVQSKKFKKDGGTAFIYIRDVESTRRIKNPENLGKLVDVNVEDDNDNIKLRYEFIFTNIQIIAYVDYDGVISARLDKVYKLLESLLP